MSFKCALACRNDRLSRAISSAHMLLNQLWLHLATHCVVKKEQHMSALLPLIAQFVTPKPMHKH